MDFIETIHRESIGVDAKRVALTIQASTAKVILIFCWYTDAKKVFQELAKRNVSNFHASICILNHRNVLFNAVLFVVNLFQCPLTLGD